MSHYSVMVCLPAETKDVDEALKQALAPYDENLDVEPYRDYESGSPEEYWWVTSVRRGAEEHGADAPVEVRRSVLDGERAGIWSNQRGGYITEAEHIADAKAARADDAVWAERLGEHPGWREVVLHYNAKYHPGNELAVPGDDSGDEGLWYDPETDRAYTMSTRNPQAMWDYWRIGGRWSGYFVADESAEDILAPEQHWDGPKSSRYGDRTVCDGGRKRSLDFAAMRQTAEDEANQDYDRWEQLVAEHGGDAKPWSHFTGLVDVVEGYTIDRARKEYHAQPIIAAHDRLERNDKGLVDWGGCLIESFLPPREEFVQQRRNSVVPAYATVLLSGEWTAPGRMGWFGMSSDGPGEREGYNAVVSRYLDELKPDTWLVVVDCHI
jgi:hypothetical protein